MNQFWENELAEMPEVREGFHIDDIDGVNWALRKLSAIAAKRSELGNLAEAEIFRVQTWLQSETKKLDGDKEYFESLLSNYAMQQRDIDPKWTKASTPYGAVKFRKRQPKWKYDDAALLESLKSAGRNDLIRVKEEPNKEELKKAARVVGGKVVDTITGSIINGVIVEEQPDAVVVEVDK